MLSTLKLSDLYLPEHVGNSGACMQILGSSRSGKTVLLKDLYRKTKLKKLPGVLFSNSLSSPSYDYFRDKLGCMYDFNPEAVQLLVNYNRRTKNAYQFVVLIDDENSAKEQKEMKNLMMTHRNNNVNTIFCSQSYANLNKGSRGSVSYAFLGAFNTDEAIEDALTKYVGSFLEGSLQEKIDLYRDLTDDHNFLFLNNFTGELSTYKAELST